MQIALHLQLLLRGGAVILLHRPFSYACRSCNAPISAVARAPSYCSFGLSLSQGFRPPPSHTPTHRDPTVPTVSGLPINTHNRSIPMRGPRRSNPGMGIRPPSGWKAIAKCLVAVTTALVNRISTATQRLRVRLRALFSWNSAIPRNCWYDVSIESGTNGDRPMAVCSVRGLKFHGIKENL